MNWSRSVVLFVLLLALTLPLGAQAPLVRLRVTVTPQAGADLDQIARTLAAAVRGRIEPYAELGFTGFVINAGPAAAEVLSRDSRVVRVDILDEHADVAPAPPPLVDPAPTTPPEPLSVVAAEHVAKRVASQSNELVLGSYVYDGAGNVTQIGPGTDQFRYDGLGRLATSTVAGVSQSYAYDSYNNLTSVTTSGSTAVIGVDAATNRLKASGPYNVFGAYDNAGRMTGYLGRDTFTYDAADMVKESVVQGQRKVYLYSPADERIASVTISGGVETSSEWTLRDNNGKVMRVYGKTMTAGERWSWKKDYIYREGQLLAAETDSAARTVHFHHDHLGTPRLLTGNGGATIGRHTYQPFGTEITAANQNTEQMKFTGHERDYAGGLTSDPLDYMHARYYSPSAGRFLSVDPKMTVDKNRTMPQRWNRYAYTANNPVKYVDPDGREIRVSVTDPVFDRMVLTAMHPQGRADFQEVHASPVVVTYSDFAINSPAAVNSMVRRVRAGFPAPTATFGLTTPNAPSNYATATVQIDTNAVSKLHPDPTGVVTTSHETHHALGIVRNVPYAQIQATDVDNSAAAYGATVAASPTDMTRTQARNWLMNLLFPPPPPPEPPPTPPRTEETGK